VISVRIIDGRHGGTGNFLRFANSYSGASSALIWFDSLIGNGATNNTVRNVTVDGNSSTSNLTGIMLSGSAMGAVAEVANSNNNVLNNVLRKAQCGVAAVGPTVMETGLVITGNTIGSATVPADRIGFRGIGVFQQNGATISENTIQGVERTNADNNAAGFF